jgi:hypothetical protein
VIRQRLRKGEHCGLVRRSHVANFEIPGFMADHARIAANHIGRHVERSPNQASSFGHSRLITFPPAMTLTWSPLRIKAKHPGGLGVDDKRRLHDWQVGRRRAFEDAVSDCFILNERVAFP